MLNLKFIYGLYDIPYLIRLSHIAVSLKIDSWITFPRCFKNEMASPYSGFPKMLLANGQQIAECDIVGVDQDIFLHIVMIVHALS